MHGRKKGKKGALALKLDVSKAYERVEWAFLRAMMVRLGFPEDWINRVMSCVTTPSFSVQINGKHMEILSHQEGSAKGTLYHLICFFYVQKGSLLCYPKRYMRGGFMVSKFVEGRLVFLTCFL